MWISEASSILRWFSGAYLSSGRILLSLLPISGWLNRSLISWLLFCAVRFLWLQYKLYILHKERICMCLRVVEYPTLSRQSVYTYRWGCQPHAPAALYSIPKNRVTWAFLLRYCVLSKFILFSRDIKNESNNWYHVRLKIRQIYS
jgi:hypothetical protein